MKYEYLVRILDQIAAEAPAKYTRKYPRERTEIDMINQVRARCMIHLFLKVNFGIVDFEERERVVTDGGYDGGIDAYYINQEDRTLYMIQSKYRTSESNFETKEISLPELLAMDIVRILEGESSDEAGNEYSGKIKQLQRDLSSVSDIARYRYRVIILANLNGVADSKLRTLVGGFHAEVFDSERTYRELVFPVLCGTYFTASDIVIPIDLSNKNAGSKISYTVTTKYAECEITALFVPALEIAKLMDKYKNSILQFNPRSYLELEGKSVNNSIRETVIASRTNELALYNNGITMLSEETAINEKIGQKNKAQLSVKNPQIINGGQTSFTLSRILNENRENAAEVFGDKELLLKVITVTACDADNKAKLIDEISSATNRQTTVINADKFSNDTFHKQVQFLVFDRFGVLYERKRGEFADGVKDKYANQERIVERNNFWRIYFAANGNIEYAVQKKLFQHGRVDLKILDRPGRLDVWFLAWTTMQAMPETFGPRVKLGRMHYARLYLFVQIMLQRLHPSEWTQADIFQALPHINDVWSRFMESVRARALQDPDKMPSRVFDRRGGFVDSQYLRSHRLVLDVKSYVASLKRDATNQGISADTQH